ncbi:hypothetical protein [Microbacterium candidum]|uniref:Uncharacterized protein n=1 Tax=Microbacterium candidum TaxID=3041922 RepID=A0ABT7N2H0_9MICO|nr:hypothetical protein [Microbacterium sp. ASV49]MDL9980905.1 hypothetical protein [Microbacterium sp. ASV49]
MGLFAERNEKTPTWAVLPSEPYEPEDGAERLDAASTASPADLIDGATSVSIVLPTAPLHEHARDETGAPGDAPASDVEES